MITHLLIGTMIKQVHSYNFHKLKEFIDQPVWREQDPSLTFVFTHELGRRSTSKHYFEVFP